MTTILVAALASAWVTSIGWIILFLRYRAEERRRRNYLRRWWMAREARLRTTQERI